VSDAEPDDSESDEAKPDDAAEAFNWVTKYTLSHHLDCVRAVAFHPRLPLIATGSDDGTIRITNLDPPKRPKVRARGPQMCMSLRGHGGAVLALAARGLQLFSSDICGAVCVWEFGEVRSGLYDTFGRCNHHLLFESREHADAVWSLAAHERVPFVISASADGTIRFLDCAQFTSAAIPVPDIPSAAVFVGDGSNFVVGSRGGVARIFASADRSEIARLSLGSPIIALLGLSLSQRFVAGVVSGAVKLCDVPGAAIVRDFIAFSKPVTALGAVSRDTFLLTASGERDLRAWRLPSLDIVYAESHLNIKFGEAGLCIAVAPQGAPGQHFALAGTDGSVKIFGPK
jgi:striatin 1/3/4